MANRDTPIHAASARRESGSIRSQSLVRRDLLRMGAGLVATIVGTSKARAQAGARQSGTAAPEPVAWPPPVRTRKGYSHDPSRAGANGPMDDTTRKIVSFVHRFSGVDLGGPVVGVLNTLMLDSVACIVAGFEKEPVRICARLAQLSPASPSLKCTVFGYGIATTPELGSFANSAMVRAMDFNDTGGARGTTQAGHPSDVIPAALAVGEALHSTGREVMAAIAIAYELRAVSSGGESAVAAMVAGKLMKLNEDQLANALSLALVPHVALNKGVGAMSMWKGVRSAEAVKCGVWGAMLARAGMTGPPQPFEGRGSLWSQNGKGREFTLPDDPSGQLAVIRTGYKRYPAEASSQAILDYVPEMRAWTTVEEIESIHHELPFGVWEEIADAPKWDSRNRETADHSMPFILARALLDGDIYLDSFTDEKVKDPRVRALVDRISVSPVQGWSGNAPCRTTIRKRSGEARTWNAQNGRRNAPSGELLSLDDKGQPSPSHRLTFQEVERKFQRACDFHQVAATQRDRARAVWSDLFAVSDVAQAVQTLATFGRPQPL
jgi:2-methylcitrate dehydratase